MIAEKANEAIEMAVCYELQNIVKNYGATYASEHEGYAVLLEETQEAREAQRFLEARLDFIWSGIRNNSKETIMQNIGEAKKFALELAMEAVQCAAVCERFLETIKKEVEHEKLD